MIKMTIQQLLIPYDTVMNGFCYAYCLALLNKLKELFKNDRVFELGNKTAKSSHVDNTGHRFQTKPLAVAILRAISIQTGIRVLAEDMKYCDLIEFISNVEEFLAIFEKKEA